MRNGLAIFDVKGMAKAIRYTEYENIHSAISEIVDNSIEAKATDILIVCHEDIGGDGNKIIKDIAIFDNGIGMDEDTLHGCLVFGMSNKKDQVGMGKFGVGLGQASMYAAPRVEVVSWRNSGTQLTVFLDTDLMSQGFQVELEPPTEVKLDPWLKSFMKTNLPNVGAFDFKENGTIIIWRNVDNVKGGLSKFYNNLSLELGRRFRYYIEEGCRIAITTTQHSPKTLVPVIDPLHLSVISKFRGDSNSLGYLSEELDAEPLFEPFISEMTPDGICKLELKLERKGVPFFSNLVIKASLIKEKYYYEAARQMGKRSPGETEIGKITRKYERISVTRVNREIQFDRFNLYDSTNDPTNRWWRIEFSFMPELDDFFGLSSNKQKVEFKTQYRTDNSDVSSFDDTSLEAEAWRKIFVTFEKLMRMMKSRNSSLAKNARTKPVVQVQENSSDTVTPYIKPKKETDIKLIIDEHKSTKFQKLYEYNKVNHEHIKANDFIILKKLGNSFTPYLNKGNRLHDQLNINENISLGFDVFLTALSSVRQKFKIYDEHKIFDRILSELNSEFTELQRILEGVENESEA